MSTSSLFPVKVYFSNGETRRFSIEQPTLKRILKESFEYLSEKTLKQKNFDVQYQDEEKDWILLETDEDFLECLKSSPKNGIKLKIIFQE
jgi:hypothetical protein